MHNPYNGTVAQLALLMVVIVAFAALVGYWLR